MGLILGLVDLVGRGDLPPVFAQTSCAQFPIWPAIGVLAGLVVALLLGLAQRNDGTAGGGQLE